MNHSDFHFISSLKNVCRCLGYISEIQYQFLTCNSELTNVIIVKELEELYMGEPVTNMQI